MRAKNNTHYIKSIDTGSTITLNVFNHDGTLVNFDQYDSVEVVIGNKTGRLLSLPATLENNQGELSFDFDDNNLLPAGDYLLEIHLNESNGDVIVAPSQGHFQLKVSKSLDQVGTVVNTIVLSEFEQKVDDAVTNANDAATYANNQGDYAKSEADRLESTDVSTLDQKVDNLVESKNLIPLFDNEAWDLHENVTVNSPSKITHTSEGTTYESSRITLSSVKPSQTYTLGIKMSNPRDDSSDLTGGYIRLQEFDGSDNEVNDVQYYNNTQTFTTNSETSYCILGLYIRSEDSSVSSSFENLTITEGSTAPDVYLPRVREEFTNHKDNTSNPHSVTKSQVGLGNVTNNEQATKSEFDEHRAKTTNTYQSKKLSEIQQPMYIGHRGAANIFPENTLEAFRGCQSLGIELIELDVRLTADGGLAVIHDDTVDRTTKNIGSVTEYTTQAFKNAEVDCLDGFKSTYHPTLDDVFKEFGKSLIYVIESKTRDSAAKIVELVHQYGLEEYCLLQSYNLTDIQQFLDNNITACVLTDDDTTHTSNELVDMGVDYVGIQRDVSNAYITDCINADLNVLIFTVNRRYEHDNLLGLGVQGFITDDPLWINGSAPILQNAPFNQKMYFHGMLKALTSRGSFIDGNKFGFTETLDDTYPNDGRDFVLQGWVGELNDTVTINLDFEYTNHKTEGWLSLVFCSENDEFDDSGSFSSGYNLILGQNGDFDLYRADQGTATKIEEMSTTSIGENNKISIQIDITSTDITVKRLDTSDTFTASDVNYRNGYLHLGRKWSAGTFENIVIS
ncbi:glycerophosphodiester phosphodiesterase [Alkalibacillus salilacus]|uniref:Glycerophosphoryl diester phosphodiesterase n=1 Tax=Alkalibacillus salilacus TaxID=284582 RepID=A0ABT9VDD6_9BACI|nr:glycerophosphodiester phosphodiesterase family protein [Alkalibacillus salilacus]MDQ0158954.1 glycerophosphoryl diester phosphodiesterase [Alkalibacillus salilacus]